MCLSKYKKIKLEGPITVYKVLYDIGDGYSSPYHAYEWKIGEMNTNNEDIEKVKGGLTSGLFHAFEFIEDAIADVQYFQLTIHNRVVVAKLTIPEDAEVFKGQCGESSCYASTKMRLDEIIPVDGETTVALRKVRYLIYPEDTDYVGPGSYMWTLSKEEFEKGIEKRKEEINTLYVTGNLKKDIIYQIEDNAEGYRKYKGWS